MLTVGKDAAGVERLLSSGRLECPVCGRRLAGWGYARTRVIRGEGGDRWRLRPRRAMCSGCRQVRVFVAVALITGFVQTVFAATVVRYVSGQHYSYNFEDGSRYSVMPVMAMTAAVVVAVDACLRRHAIAGGGDRIPLVRRSPGALTAVITALACVLALGWLSDYRYVTQRTSWGHWKPVAEGMLTACKDSTTGEITTWTWGHSTITIPCSRLRR